MTEANNKNFPRKPARGGIPAKDNRNIASKNADTGYTAGRSHTHGVLGPKLKWAGFDGIIFTGASDKPVYLYVHDGKAELKDAGKLWGKVLQKGLSGSVLESRLQWLQRDCHAQLRRFSQKIVVAGMNAGPQLLLEHWRKI